MTQHEKPQRWSLDDLIPQPTLQGLDDIFAKMEAALVDFESTKGLLSDEISLPDFRKVTELLETINTLKSKVEAYADLSFAEDTQNPSTLNLRDRIDQVLTDMSNRAMFFEFWFKELPDKTAAYLIENSGDLHYFLETMRRFKPHTLSELEEQMINLKDVNGIDAMMNLYEMITGEFTFEMEIDGETQTITRDQLSSYFQDPSPDVREKSYQELYRVYIKNSTILAQMYIHRVRDWHTEGIELRKFSTPISARNLENDLPDEVVDTLLSVCRANANVFQRYFKLKAKMLGLEKLRRYDIYAPLTPSTKKFEYADAVQMVMDSYQAFSPQVVKAASRIFEENHLDSEIRAGKRGGAFCYAVIPELTPWVMVNYDGGARDIATLAHELGHAVHAMLANQHSVLTQQACLPLAETASVFAEMQLTDLLLKRENDRSVRRDLLANALDDAYITVMRQAYFTIFEKEAHDMINENASLDEIAEAYAKNLKEQFGDTVECPNEFKWEWIAVPHFYINPFYTYAYSFGQLLVLALYQQYRTEGESFVPKYLKLLAYGGSKPPMNILQEAGLDVSTPDFWQGGFEVIKNMITELEQLS